MNGIFDLPLAMFPAEILQRLGYRSDQLIMKKARTALMDAMDEARAAAHPRAIVRTLPLEKEARKLIIQDPSSQTCLHFTDAGFISAMNLSSQISIFAITLGSGLYDKIQEYQEKEEDARAEILTAVQEDVLGQSVNLLREQMIMQGIQEGFQLTQCFDMKESSEAQAQMPEIWKILHKISDAQSESMHALSASHASLVMAGLIGWIPFEALENL